MGAHLGETSDNLRGFRDTQSRESLVQTNVRAWHDRDVDYTEGHDLSCPYGRRSLTPKGELRRYALFALVGGGAAALAVATSDVNAAASLTAMSARTLRSSVTPATFNPWINWP